MSSKKEEVKERLLKCLQIDESDYTDEGTIAEFYDAAEFIEAKQKVGDEFDIDVEQMDEETTLSEMIDVITAHLEAQGE